MSDKDYNFGVYLKVLPKDRAKVAELEKQLEERRSTNVGWRHYEAEKALSKQLYEALIWARGNLTEYGHHQMISDPKTGLLEAIAAYEEKKQ